MVLVRNLLIAGRNLRSRKLFTLIEKHCKGKVLDVGGGDFYRSIRKTKTTFDCWTTLEADKEFLFGMKAFPEENHSIVLGDGCNTTDLFADESFDTVLNVHVLEHVMDPAAMLADTFRVLKPGGKAIFLIPQTASMHLAPNVYYNFTRFWVQQAMPKAGLEISHLEHLGGFWTTIASRLFFLPFQVLGVQDRSYPELHRSPLFWIFLPFMLLFATLIFPLTLFFGLADLEEECNNHLVLTVKRENQ